ncbi:MAG: hypothetical protein QRY16_06510 [Enterobacterales bacterium endosymbiont of Blomia tropicalis]|uniref:hypothetical protein n=1 Tax=Mixta mediterraneensis TaxID=2758443 RepID=UPI0025A84FB4|nr:hypothetical protein [Mixta mediterraneensis]MDL4913453.1 hypothetical protein [Mixta mediterraneensis]
MDEAEWMILLAYRLINGFAVVPLIIHSHYPLSFNALVINKNHASQAFSEWQCVLFFHHFISDIFSGIEFPSEKSYAWVRGLIQL